MRYEGELLSDLFHTKVTTCPLFMFVCVGGWTPLHGGTNISRFTASSAGVIHVVICLSSVGVTCLQVTVAHCVRDAWLYWMSLLVTSAEGLVHCVLGAVPVPPGGQHLPQDAVWSGLQGGGAGLPGESRHTVLSEWGRPRHRFAQPKSFSFAFRPCLKTWVGSEPGTEDGAPCQDTASPTGPTQTTRSAR